MKCKGTWWGDFREEKLLHCDENRTINFDSLRVLLVGQTPGDLTHEYMYNLRKSCEGRQCQ